MFLVTREREKGNFVQTRELQDLNFSQGPKDDTWMGGFFVSLSKYGTKEE